MSFLTVILNVNKTVYVLVVGQLSVQRFLEKEPVPRTIGTGTLAVRKVRQGDLVCV